jgi:hypothetical protein
MIYVTVFGMGALMLRGIFAPQSTYHWLRRILKHRPGRAFWIPIGLMLTALAFNLISHPMFERATSDWKCRDWFSSMDTYTSGFWICMMALSLVALMDSLIRKQKETMYMRLLTIGGAFIPLLFSLMDGVLSAKFALFDLVSTTFQMGIILSGTFLLHQIEKRKFWPARSEK